MPLKLRALSSVMDTELRTEYSGFQPSNSNLLPYSTSRDQNSVVNTMKKFKTGGQTQFAHVDSYLPS